MSDSLLPPWTEACQACPSLSAKVCSNSCPLSQWWHSTISSSIAPFSFCLHLSPHQGLFQWTVHIRWQKYWNFSFSISPSNDNSGFISFRINWFDLLDVQGTPKTLLQHQSWKASILWYSVFFMIQHSHLYMTAGKTTALTIGIIVNKGMSLLFNMLSQVGHSFSSKKQASFNFMAAVIIYNDFGAQENSLSLFPLFAHLFAMKWWDRILIFWILSFKPAFSLSSFTFNKSLFSASLLSFFRICSFLLTYSWFTMLY